MKVTVVALVLALLATPLAAAPATQQRACREPRPPVAPFSASSISCWLQALQQPGQQQPGLHQHAVARGAVVAVSSWAALQAAVQDGARHIKLLGLLHATTPLQLSGARGLHVDGGGSAHIVCTDGAASAFIISRSSQVELRNLTISGCSSSAVVVNATSPGRVMPLTSAGSSSGLAPDVVMANVTIERCKSVRGAGVAAVGSRVALLGCTLRSNTAEGCGGGVFADSSSLLVADTTFADNEGSNTDADETCQGGALHAQSSWVHVVSSSFVGNRGVNGSAILLVQPVGVAQLQGSSFRDNAPRQGVADAFTSSAGAVFVRGSGDDELFPYKMQRGMAAGKRARCQVPREGLAVQGCSFINNTAASTGGLGGAVGAFGAFLAIINSNVAGMPGAAAAGGTNVSMGAARGGCISVEQANFLLQGSSIHHCSARFVGGAVSSKLATMVASDTELSDSYADMAGGWRATNSRLLMSNVTITRCRALSIGAGLFIESDLGAEVHLERLSVTHCSTNGMAGAVYAEAWEEEAALTLTMHNSVIAHNKAGTGAGMGLFGVTRGDLHNNVIAHNTAISQGGGLACRNWVGRSNLLVSRGNIWLNNTALTEGGGMLLAPCNITLDGDSIAGNTAITRGGGIALLGGDRMSSSVVLQRTSVAHNAARAGAGAVIDTDNDEFPSTLQLLCNSSITANGHGVASLLVATTALPTTAVAALALPQVDGTSEAHATAAVAAAAASMHSQRGGAMFVAGGQMAVIAGSAVAGNVASSSGGGIFLGKGAQLVVKQGSIIRGNNCTSGAGGGLFLSDGAQLLAQNATWSGNQGVFGGAVFAMGNTTALSLTACRMHGNTAAAGGAVATLGGSRVTCSSNCAFENNTAKAGGALLLHAGSSLLKQAQLTGNRAGSGHNAASSTTGASSIHYMLGGIQAAAGGAIYVWQGSLRLHNTSISRNAAGNADGRGGGVFVDNARLQLVNSSMAHNQAGAAGGAVCLGAAGSRQLLEATRSTFTSNTAGRFGGAVAGGLLLPGDAAAAAAAPPPGASTSATAGQWEITLQGSTLSNNSAGRQGGGVACNFCGSLALSSCRLSSNSAGQTGGGISSIDGGSVQLQNCVLANNTALSGAGAAILAPGQGSRTVACTFAGNTAGSTAPGSGTTLPSPQDILPACGVAGAGGGLCLGLWRAGFTLAATSFVGNTGAFGAGAFVQACPGGRSMCPLEVEAGSLTFANNQDSSSSSGQVSTVRGTGSNMYVTNATVLVAGARPVERRQSGADWSEQQQQQQSHAAVEASQPQVHNSSSSSASTAQSQQGRHLLAVPPALQGTQVMQQLVRAASGSGSNSESTAFSTGPALLGPVDSPLQHGPSVARLPAAVTASTMADEIGVVDPLQLPVLDQLGMAIAPGVAQQLSVEAAADFGNCTACQLAGVRKVAPVGSAAQFDDLQLLARPGSSHEISFRLLSAAPGVDFPAARQSLRVRLPTCTWGQATTAIGCYNCSAPLFTFVPGGEVCSSCPDSTAVCSGAMLLPQSGYWSSGPVSAYMHKCRNRAACIRNKTSAAALQCLQQQQLIINNPGASSQTQAGSAWAQLSSSCQPVLAQLASGSGSGQVSLNDTSALLNLHHSLMCSQGYTSTLCSQCVFPGTEEGGTYGATGGTCGRCPNLKRARIQYALARSWDLGNLSIFIFIVLVEMRKRRKEVAASGSVAASPPTSTAPKEQSVFSRQQLAQLEQQSAAAHTSCPAPALQSGKECAAGSGSPAAADNATSGQLHQPTDGRQERRVPLFRREHSSSQWLEGIEAGELLEVLRDFMQLTAILQTVLLGWQTVVASVLSVVAATPMSTRAWISLDCTLPRTELVAELQTLIGVVMDLLLPASFALLLMACWLAYAALVARARRTTILEALRLHTAGIINTMVELLDYFYPAIAYTILRVFACRRLDPAVSPVPGNVSWAVGWWWSADMSRHCMADPLHRGLMFGLGVPGLLLLLAYPVGQALLLSRKAVRGELAPGTQFYADYGNKFESYRPRLYYWESVTLAVKLVLVAVVLCLESSGSMAQLLGCSLVLIVYLALLMAMLPYPARLLNHLCLTGVGALLVVVWLSMLSAVREELASRVPPGTALLPQLNLALQLVSMLLVVGVVLLMLAAIARRLYVVAHEFLDADADGRVSKADIRATAARLQARLQQQWRLSLQRRSRQRVRRQRRSRVAHGAAPAAAAGPE